MWNYVIAIGIVAVSLLICLPQELYFRKQRRICQQQKLDCEASEEILRQTTAKGR